MASAHAIAVQAAVFAIGFPVIHALRRHAQAVGQVLILITVLLGVVALLAAAGINAEYSDQADIPDMPLSAEP